MKHRPSPWWLLSGVAFVALAQAAEVPAQGNPQQEGVDVMVADAKVSIDAKTGKLRPVNAAESKKLSEAMRAMSASQRSPAHAARYGRQPASELEVQQTKRTRADGSVAVRAPESLMTEVRAFIDADGNVVITEGDAAGTQGEHQ
jgi:hypothetical protein